MTPGFATKICEGIISLAQWLAQRLLAPCSFATVWPIIVQTVGVNYHLIIIAGGRDARIRHKDISLAQPQWLGVVPSCSFATFGQSLCRS